MTAAASHDATAGPRDMIAPRHGTATPRRHPVTHPNATAVPHGRPIA